MLSDAQVEAVASSLMRYDRAAVKVAELSDMLPGDYPAMRMWRSMESESRDAFRLALEDCVRTLVREELGASSDASAPSSVAGCDAKLPRLCVSCLLPGGHTGKHYGRGKHAEHYWP